MHALLLTCRCLLAVVFLVAAAGKLLDLTGSRRALEDFGVPRRFAPVGVLLLPAAELSVAVALVIRPSARWGAIGAILLLLAFGAAVARAIAQGRAPDCHCFGQIHSEPAGAPTLIRNLLLAPPAVLIVAAGPGPSLTGALASLNGTQAALVATAVLAAVLAAIVGHLWGERRRLLRELDAAIAAKVPPGLPRGAPAPTFDVSPVRGHARSLEDLLDNRRSVVLLFISTGCAPCLQMLSTLSRWQDSLSPSLALAAIFSGDRSEVARLSEEHALSLVLNQESNEIFELYRLRATPSAVLVGADGLIGEAPAEGVPAIEALIRVTLARDGPASPALAQSS